MNPNKLLTLAVSFITDFLISAGTAMVTGMVGQAAVDVPSKGVWILAAVSGAVAGARRVQALLAEPPKA